MLDQVGHASLEPGGNDSLRFYRQSSGLDRSLKHAMICSRLGAHTQHAEEKKHRTRAVVRIFLASVLQLVFVSFLRMLFLAPVFVLVIAMLYLYARGYLE